MMILFNSYIWLTTKDKILGAYSFYLVTLLAYALNKFLSVFTGTQQGNFMENSWSDELLNTINGLAYVYFFGSVFKINDANKIIKIVWKAGLSIMLLYITFLIFTRLANISEFYNSIFHILLIAVVFLFTCTCLLYAIFLKKKTRFQKIILIGGIFLFVIITISNLQEYYYKAGLVSGMSIIFIGYIIEQFIFALGTANHIQKIYATAEELKISSYKQQAEMEKQLIQQELVALRSQMNPHFIFNSLNAIKMLVAGNQNEMGLQYLSKFSKLMRMVLDESENNFTSLRDELKMLDLYLQLESLRFGESFFYTITMDEGMDDDDMQIPSFIIQPVVENSVWHGLLHKEGERRLMIHFSSTKSQCLQCVIKDNGIGIEAGSAMKEQRLEGNIQKPKGLQMLRERLLLLQSQFGVQTSLTMEDLKDNSGFVSGTRVTIEMPFK